MNQEASPRSQREIDQSFAEIISQEYGTAAARQIMGEAAIRQTIPFGNQLMSDLPEIPASPLATTPGGQTITTDGGRASLDDPSSNDVS